MATVTAEVTKNLNTIVTGLNGGIGKSSLINAERDAKKLLKETLNIKTLELAEKYIVTEGGIELNADQVKRLKIWYAAPKTAAPLTLEKAVVKYAEVSDEMLIALLKARGFKKISK